MPEESEEDESFEAGSDEGDSDDESVDAEDGVTGVRPLLVLGGSRTQRTMTWLWSYLHPRSST